jgi:hypothetical protein
MIRFWCECGRELQATEQYVGGQAVCPACGRTMTVPASDQPVRVASAGGYAPLDPRRHAIESGPPAAWQAEPRPRRNRLATGAVVLGGLCLVVLFSAALLRYWRPKTKVEPADEPDEVVYLIQGLSDDDPDVRSYSATRLLTMDLGEHTAEVVEPLTKLLGDPHNNIRTSAAKALGRIGKEATSAAGPMAPLLSDPDVDVRREAAIALGQIGSGDERAVAALGKALRDPDEDVRHAAAEALGKIGPAARSAVAALQDAARDGDQETRTRAERSLRQIGP